MSLFGHLNHSVLTVRPTNPYQSLPPAAPIKQRSVPWPVAIAVPVLAASLLAAKATVAAHLAVVTA
jgi:hypothetical protein